VRCLDELAATSVEASAAPAVLRRTLQLADFSGEVAEDHLQDAHAEHPQGTVLGTEHPD
jgi:hypothetical protein